MKQLIFVALAALAGCGPAVNRVANVNDSAHSAAAELPFAGLPDPRDVTIYQVNIRTFSEAGNFMGVMPRLDSIKALGANVLYMMPHYPLGKVKSVNSPYCISDYKGVNEEFGSLEDLKELVRAAHRSGLAVILDWVGNHTAYDHPWTANKSWYLQDSAGNIVSPPNTGWNDVAQLNFNSSDMRLAMIDAMKYWVENANIDGFRCDYADGPPVDFWKQALDTLYGMKGRKLLMLAEGSRPDHFSIGFHYNFGFNFFGNLKRVFEHGRSASLIDSVNRAEYRKAGEEHRVVRYTSNHDVNGSDGTPQELFGNLRGSMAAFVVAAYMKGVPMIYNGQEVGTPYRLTFPFTAANINWKGNGALTEEYKKLISFRNSSAAVRRGKLQSFGNDDVCAFTKTLNGEEVLVLANLRNKPVPFALPAALQHNGWKDALHNKAVEVKSGLTLEPYTYLILKKG